jgi:radical SAM protein with 4Fe4S-binding SPASM domain
MSIPLVYPRLKDRAKLKMFEGYACVYDLNINTWDLIHPSKAVFLSMCTGAYTIQQLEFLMSEVYQLSPEVSNELVDTYMKKSLPFLDLFTESNPYEYSRYNAKSFLCKSTDSIVNYKYLPTSVPVAISINLSFKCNFHCRYCYQALSYDNEKLDLNKCLMLIREAAEWGVVYVSLTGGEPTLFDGWMILLEEILSLGMNPAITTNGVIIGSRPYIAEHLKAIGLKEITVSLDASTPELHHYITRSQNTFSKVIDAISYLVNSGITVTVKSVLTRDNIKDIGNLIDLLVKLKVSEIGISRCESGALGSEANKISPLELKEMAIVWKKIEEKNIQYSGVCKIHPPRDTSCISSSKVWYPCGGLYHGMYIFPTGKVSVCDKLREDTPFIHGDVFKNSLKEIRGSKDFQRLFEQTVDTRIIDADCSMCSKLEFCRTSCFVDSMHLKGNYFAKNPCCSGPFQTS